MFENTLGFLDPQADAVKCEWNDEDDLKRPKKDIKPSSSVQRKLSFVKESHTLNYFCDCKIHTGLCYLVDLNHNNYRVVCEAGRDKLLDKYSENFCHDMFMLIPTKGLIDTY